MTRAYPFPPPYPTLLQCPLCGQAKRLASFRRLEGFKRILFTTCNECQPEKKLSQLTPIQRDARLMHALQTTPSDTYRAQALARTIDQLNEGGRRVRRAKIADAALRMHSATRRVNWTGAILSRIHAEQRWVHTTLLRIRSAAHTTPEYASWSPFFEAYAQVLKEVNRKATTASRRRVGPLQPTKEEANPYTYTSPSTLRSLRTLYAEGTRIPQSRGFREPWCLTWGETPATGTMSQ